MSTNKKKSALKAFYDINLGILNKYYAILDERITNVLVQLSHSPASETLLKLLCKAKLLYIVSIKP